jgi:anaerobic magnesium-protoporphyrin IX monomethyl ester cyclase
MQVSNIALIMPNFKWRSPDFDVQKDPPMGLLYVASALETRGYNVSVIDANAEDLSIQDVIVRLKKGFSHVVGISCNYAPLHNSSIDLCREIKKFNKEIVTIMGGNHATASYKSLFEMGGSDVDIIILGQGEYTFPNIIASINNAKMRSTVKGIAYKMDGLIVTTPPETFIKNLDELSYPAYHLVDMKKYDRYNVITSRGCPYRCTYCASNVITGGKVAVRSPKNILYEIKKLLTKYGDKIVWFSDDTFTANTKHTNDLLDLIISDGIKFKWSCLTRVNTTSKELLEKMKKAGCQYISYGVESADDGIIDAMNKKITMEDVEKTLKLTKKIGIDMYLFFIVGYPGDTIDTINKSFKLIKKVKPSGVAFNILIPLPGTPLWKELEEKGLVDFRTIQWDTLFAREGGDSVSYSAKIAEKWCELSEKDIIDTCNKGNSLFK